VRKKILAVVAAACAIAALTVAVGTGSAARHAGVKVALVTDIGGLNDKGFNHLAYLGLKRAQTKLGVDGRVFITQQSQDRLGNLQSAAKDGYGLVIGTGFNFFQDYPQVAPAFPSTKFGGVDVPAAAVTPAQKNYHGLVFREQEAGYLVGYVAGLMIHLHPHKGKQIVSAVGANPVPAIVHYLAGFRAGAKKADPKVTVLLNYANDPTFADQAKCKETTLNQIQQGSGVVFEAAGACGLGGLDAAKEQGIWGIGVDADQGFLGKHILTSALKNVALSVYQAIAAYKKNPSGFKGGFDKVYSVKNGGVGYGKLSTKLSKADRAFITKKLKVIKKQIASGKIKPPSQ
jgi:basic membrane protein A and related proteins